MTPRRPYETMSTSEMIESTYNTPLSCGYGGGVNVEFIFHTGREFEDDEEEFNDFDMEDEDYDEDDEEEDDFDDLELIDENGTEFRYQYNDKAMNDPDKIFLAPYRSYGIRYGKLLNSNLEYFTLVDEKTFEMCVDCFIARIVFFQALKTMLMTVKMYVDDASRLHINFDLPNYNNISNMNLIVDAINDMLDDYEEVFMLDASNFPKDYRFTYEDFEITFKDPSEMDPNDNIENIPISRYLFYFLSHGFVYLFYSTQLEEEFQKKESEYYIFNFRIYKESDYVAKPEKIENMVKDFKNTTSTEHVRKAVDEYIEYGKALGIFDYDYTYDKI